MNLLSTFGPLGGLLVTYALLLVAFYWLSRKRNVSSAVPRLNLNPGECSMKEIVPDYRLDMVGEPCPYPAVATLEALPQLQKGKFWKW